MTHFKIYLFSFIFIPSILLAQAPEDFSQFNINYQYDFNAEIKFDHQAALANDTVFLYFHITTKPGIRLQDNYRIIYYLKENYTSENSLLMDTISFEEELVEVFRNKYYLKYLHPNQEEGKVGIFSILNLNTETEYLFDIPLHLPNSFPLSSLIAMQPDRNIPFFNGFINETDSFRIMDLSDGSVALTSFWYNEDFAAAYPPMVTDDKMVQEIIKEDSIFQIESQSVLHLDSLGLFLFQTDTASLESIAFRVQNKYFPKLSKIDKVIQPLIYITTKGERESLTNASEPKKALDKFWLNIANSEQQARLIIMEYFRQVRAANVLFTGFKEGWKTDQGMIYILFGNPDQVYRDQEQEVWVYENQEQNRKVAFNFLKVRNFFDRHYYTLMRNEDYDNIWFRTVDRWRKGLQDI